MCTPSQQLSHVSMLRSECFRRNLSATFRVERNNVPALIASVGEDSVLFETDFPHPTGLYPKPLDTVADKMSTLTPAGQRKILGENAANLYRLCSARRQDLRAPIGGSFQKSTFDPDFPRP